MISRDSTNKVCISSTCFRYSHELLPQTSLNPTLAKWISTSQEREEAWKFCATAIERHYEERLKRWNAELDMLLVFVRVTLVRHVMKY